MYYTITEKMFIEIDRFQTMFWLGIRSAKDGMLDVFMQEDRFTAKNCTSTRLKMLIPVLILPMKKRQENFLNLLLNIM